MKLSIAIASIFAPLSCYASYERIAGYEPGSQVTDHNAIDLDQKSIETQLALQTEESFDKAEEIYNNGGHSKSYAKILLTEPTGLRLPLAKGTPVSGTTTSGESVTGKLYSDAEAGDRTIKIQYKTLDVQEMYVGCQVGSLPPNEHVTFGCFDAAGTISIDGGDDTYEYTYDVATDNLNGRTIAGFSTSAEEKQLSGCPGCPYAEYKKYYDYYGVADYAHQWVSAALDGESTNFANGNADFSKYSLIGRSEAVKKATAYMNIYMYVIREFEDAIDDCQKGCIDCNDDPVHAWDEGVAFYTGSELGTDGKGSGKLVYTLADKRCQNYGTCGVNGDEMEGTSFINHELFQLFTLGNYNLVTGQCDIVRKNVDEIVNLMAVPLIQGTLRYSYKVDKLSGAEKEAAEGAVFAAAVLPRVAACSPEDAQVIYDNMMVGATTTDHAAVKEAFENNYECMNINGKLVGGLFNDATGTYYEGAEPKADKSTKQSNSSLVVGLSVAFGVIAALALMFIVRMITREQAGKPMFMDVKAVDA